MTTIAKLAVGDRVRDRHGDVGCVTAFTRDHVRITWGDDVSSIGYTDADLRERGIAKISPIDGSRK